MNTNTMKKNLLKEYRCLYKDVKWHLFLVKQLKYAIINIKKVSKKGIINMNDLFIIDNYVDEREFRNYINSLLKKKGYERISIDDPRIADHDKFNDNDIIAKKGELYFTIQTYLNTNIGEKQIKETLEDIQYEKISTGIIITNNYVDNKIKDYANKNLIQIWDRSELEKDIEA